MQPTTQLFVFFGQYCPTNCPFCYFKDSKNPKLHLDCTSKDDVLRVLQDVIYYVNAHTSAERKRLHLSIHGGSYLHYIQTYNCEAEFQKWAQQLQQQTTFNIHESELIDTTTELSTHYSLSSSLDADIIEKLKLNQILPSQVQCVGVPEVYNIVPDDYKERVGWLSPLPVRSEEQIEKTLQFKPKVLAQIFVHALACCHSELSFRQMLTFTNTGLFSGCPRGYINIRADKLQLLQPTALSLKQLQFNIQAASSEHLTSLIQQHEKIFRECDTCSIQHICPGPCVASTNNLTCELLRRIYHRFPKKRQQMLQKRIRKQRGTNLDLFPFSTQILNDLAAQKQKFTGY